MCQEWKLNSGMRQIRFPESSISDLIFTKSSNGLWLGGFCETISAHTHKGICTWPAEPTPYSFEVVLGVAVPPKHYLVPTQLCLTWTTAITSSQASYFSFASFSTEQQSGSLKTRHIPLPFYSRVSKSFYFLRIKAEFLRVKA